MTMALAKLCTTLRKQQNLLEHRNQGWLHRKVQEAFHLCHPILQSGAAQNNKETLRGISPAGKREQDSRHPAHLWTSASFATKDPTVWTNAEPSWRSCPEFCHFSFEMLELSLWWDLPPGAQVPAVLPSPGLGHRTSPSTKARDAAALCSAPCSTFGGLTEQYKGHALLFHTPLPECWLRPLPRHHIGSPVALCTTSCVLIWGFDLPSLEPCCWVCVGNLGDWGMRGYYLTSFFCVFLSICMNNISKKQTTLSSLTPDRSSSDHEWSGSDLLL